MSGSAVNEFRQRVIGAFGARLEHATPATVRDFIDQLRREQWRTKRVAQIRDTGNPTIDISDPGGPSSYEGVLREFFLDSLTTADDQALIELWLFALELAYAGIEEVDADRIGKLFGPA